MEAISVGANSFLHQEIFCIKLKACDPTMSLIGKYQLA